MSTLAEKIAVMHAAADGAKILRTERQYQNIHAIDDNPTWNWERYIYSVIPKRLQPANPAEHYDHD